VAAGLTKELWGTIEQYDTLSLKFEAVYAGFLNSAEQIDCVTEAAARLKSEDGVTLIDPVMGDNGIVYETYTDKLCSRMRELCEIADIITPNATEAAILLDKPPNAIPHSADEACEWMEALNKAFGADVVLTGLDYEPGRIGSGCMCGGKCEIFLHRRINSFYPGTGDIFDSVLLGQLLNGNTLKSASVTAGEFVSDCIAYTSSQNTAPAYGVMFEKLIGRLIPQ